jgi:SAM-dependent methyltransferase
MSRSRRSPTLQAAPHHDTDRGAFIISTTTTPTTAIGPWLPTDPELLRSRLLGPLHGSVLEIGPGPGVNLRYYPSDVRWTGIEPSHRHRTATWREAARLRRTVQVLPGHAERLPLPDHSVDAVVGTYVLCSVEDPDAALAEVRRVLRPGGRYIFAEHVGAPKGSWTRRGQDAWTLLTGLRSGSCRTNRDSQAAIARAGFHAVDLHRSTLPGPLGTALPQIAGGAR